MSENAPTGDPAPPGPAVDTPASPSAGPVNDHGGPTGAAAPAGGEEVRAEPPGHPGAQRAGQDGRGREQEVAATRVVVEEAHATARSHGTSRSGDGTAAAESAARESVRAGLHQLVDLALDAAAVLRRLRQDLRRDVPGRLAGPMSQVATALAVPGARRPGASTSISASTSPGGTAVLYVGVYNDRPEPATLRMAATDLSAAHTGRISAKEVSLEPAVLQIPPNGRAEMTVRVHVPVQTLPGLYHGALQQDGEPRVRTTVIVEVR